METRITQTKQALNAQNLDFITFDGTRPYEFDENKVVAGWKCSRLGDDGLCTDYENRPQLCIDYQPMSDGLCAIRPFKGIPILVERP